MKNRLFAYFIILMIPLIMTRCNGGSMDSDDINSYLPDAVDGWRAVGEPRIFDRDGIFKYINGAGEVYRQYDYRQVLVKQYAGRDNITITVELFDMGMSSDAYGIFSHSRETPDIGIGQGSEFKNGLLCFWKNRYFACFYSEEQNNRTDIAIAEFAAKIDSLIPEEGKIPEIVGFLPGNSLAESRVRFFHRNTSLNLHYYLADENLLNLDDNTNVVFVEYEPDAIRVLLIEYLDTQSANVALDRFKSIYIPDADSSGMEQIENDKWVLARLIDKYLVVILDSPDDQRAGELYRQTSAKINDAIVRKGKSDE